MKLTIGIEVDGQADFDKLLAAVATLSEQQATGAKPEVRRGRPPKDTATTNKADGAAGGDPLLPEGKGPAAANDALAGIDDDLKAPPTAAMTYDAFLAEVRKLAAPSDKHNAAVRKRLNELGFEQVKQVPPEKYADTLAELGKVKP
jgi:hypothetical protein